jgi:hypothetical protein
MSRYEDGDYDESFPNQGELWRANAHRALKGKKGCKVLAELREALKALPEPRLIDSAMCTIDAPARGAKMVMSRGDYASYAKRQLDETVEIAGEGVCAVGAYLWFKKVKAGMDEAAAFAALPTLVPEESDGYGLDATANLAVAEGVVFGLAWTLAYKNDEELAKCTPEERWTKFMDWIDAELQETSA